MEAAETTSRKKLTPRYGRFVTRLRGNPAAVHEWRYGITPCSSRATVVGSNRRLRVGIARDQTARIVTAKKWANMLGFRASYEGKPESGPLAP